jgi:hypothetical protein
MVSERFCRHKCLRPSGTRRQRVPTPFILFEDKGVLREI